MQRPSLRLCLVAPALLSLLLECAPSRAQEDAAGGGRQAILAGLLDQDTLTGDWDGIRSGLRDRGIALGATEISEVLGTPDGPNGAAAIYEGRFELDLDLDLEKIVGLSDAVVHANVYQIHGRGLSQNYLGGNLLIASDIEALRGSRLFDLWLQKGFLDSALSVRVGQIAADDEFITSQYAATFVNATFGWPALASANLPAGGPAYPLATPGIRIKNAFTDEFSLQAAAFGGDPAGAPSAHPQTTDPSGTTFSLRGGSFIIAEGAYSPQVEGGSQNWLAAYKIGAWYHTGPFDDQRDSRSGLPLANPASGDLPLRHRGDAGIYAIVDQPFYQVGDSEGRGAAAFLRVGFAPGQQNVVARYLDAGIDWKGPLDARPDDLAGIAFGYAELSGAYLGFERDLRRFGQARGAVADFEGVIELTYQAALAPWWSVQPDLQYVIHPTTTIGTAVSPDGTVVAGLRTSIRF